MSRTGNGAAQQTAKAAQEKQTDLVARAIRARKTRSPEESEEPDSRVKGLDTGWTVFSYLIGGMVAYGAIGWGIGKAVHIGLLFPIGMMVGLAISVSFVIYRYGRQGSVERNDR